MNRARLTRRRDARRRQLCRRVTLIAPAAPPMTSVLAGKKFTPPFKGTAEIDFIKPVTKNEKDMVITTIMVKNNVDGPIAPAHGRRDLVRRAGGLVTGGKGVDQRPAAARRSQTIKIETPFNPKMKANNYNFTHANGTVKPHDVAKLTAGGDKEPAAKPRRRRRRSKKLRQSRACFEVARPFRTSRRFTSALGMATRWYGKRRGSAR